MVKKTEGRESFSIRRYRPAPSPGYPTAVYSILRTARIAAAVALCIASPAARASGPPSQARQLIAAALSAQGGEEKLRGLTSVRWRATGYRSAVEQSERPEGPYIIEMLDISELHLPRDGRMRMVAK